MEEQHHYIEGKRHYSRWSEGDETRVNLEIAQQAQFLINLVNNKTTE